MQVLQINFHNVPNETDKRQRCVCIYPTLSPRTRRKKSSVCNLSFISLNLKIFFFSSWHTKVRSMTALMFANNWNGIIETLKNPKNNNKM